MAANAAAKNKKIRQDALREQLAAKGLVQKVLDTADKFDERSKGMESNEIQALKAATDIRLRLINKYLPDLKAVEITGSDDEDAPPLKIVFESKAPIGDISTTNAKP